jgi:hypothetical protein
MAPENTGFVGKVPQAIYFNAWAATLALNQGRVASFLPLVSIRKDQMTPFTSLRILCLLALLSSVSAVAFCQTDQSAQAIQKMIEPPNRIDTSGDRIGRLLNTGIQRPDGAAQRRRQAENRQVDEIIALRDGLGGSVVGSVFGAENGLADELNGEFQAELARLVRQGADEPQDRMPEAQLMPGELPRVALSEKVHAIRTVSRQLEQLAWDLEDIQAYVEADRLREQAMALRIKAREAAGQ